MYIIFTNKAAASQLSKLDCITLNDFFQLSDTYHGYWNTGSTGFKYSRDIGWSFKVFPQSDVPSLRDILTGGFQTLMSTDPHPCNNGGGN